MRLPHRILVLYAILAALMVPWITWLSLNLPAKHVARHWDIAWGGFDVALLISLALTAYFGLRRSTWVVVTASASGTLLLIDAWFDNLTVSRASESVSALVLAFGIEIPLAVLSFWLAYRAGRRPQKRP